MTSLLFDEDGLFGVDINACVERESSMDVFRERPVGGQFEVRVGGRIGLAR